MASPVEPAAAPAPEWWRDAVIYQVYVRSLMDSDGDGVGDLGGVLARLDYLASLGVDALWLTPFFRSPMKDFGYDVSDYREVDPLFGTLADFDRLLAAAHERGLRLFIDLVLSHTSDEHEWFRQSRASRANPRADWYVWADPKEDGTPPNNWLSMFGGSAWAWEPRRGQYYLHNFLACQPDLNFHNPQVRAQVLEETEFWLRRGVDGLRLDAINFCFHDRALRDNPPKPVAERKARGFSVSNPYAFQRHLRNNTQPEVPSFLEELRARTDSYPGVVTLGEVSSEDSLGTLAEYTAPGRLHMAYSFELLSAERSPAHIRATVEDMESRLDNGWPCWCLGNHDVERVLTRWGGAGTPVAQARMLNALLLSLRGSVCTYQGEELGLVEAEVSREHLQDPYGIAFWPDFKGRDGCRTPMPWGDGGDGGNSGDDGGDDGAASRRDQASSADPRSGFTRGSPWLPLDPRHCRQSVASQEGDGQSPLNAYRAMIRFRKSQPALRWGDIEFLASAAGTLAYRRRWDGDCLLCLFNLGDRPATMALPAEGRTGSWQDAGASDCGAITVHDDGGGQVSLPAYGFAFLAWVPSTAG